MKKNIVFIIILCVFTIKNVYPDIQNGFQGTFENKHFYLKVRSYTSAQTYTGRGRRRVLKKRFIIFKIQTKQGYKLLNKTFIKLKNKTYFFKGKIINNYLKKGKIVITGTSIQKNMVLLTYFICKTSSDTCIRVPIKLKIKKKPSANNIYCGRLIIKKIESGM